MEKDIKDRLKAAMSGDRGAFCAVYEQMKTPVFTVAYRITQSHELAEDITQDVFLKLLSLPYDTSVKKPRAFIFRIAHNSAIDALRKRRDTAELGDYAHPAEDFLSDRIAVMDTGRGNAAASETLSINEVKNRVRSSNIEPTAELDRKITQQLKK